MHCEVDFSNLESCDDDDRCDWCCWRCWVAMMVPMHIASSVRSIYFTNHLSIYLFERNMIPGGAARLGKIDSEVHVSNGFVPC